MELFFSQVKELIHPGKVYNDLMNLIVRLAEYGLIHCDFNEFNLIIDQNEDLTLIDFPQMISTSHVNAEMYFDRDVQCIRTFFLKKFGFVSGTFPRLGKDTEKKYSLDVEVAASGFTKNEEQQMEELQKEIQKEEEIIPLENQGQEQKLESESEEEEISGQESSQEEKEIILKEEEKKESDVPVKENIVAIESLAQSIEDTSIEGEEEEDDIIDHELLRKKVKQSLAKRNKPKLKVNISKNRIRHEARGIIKDWS